MGFGTTGNYGTTMTLTGLFVGVPVPAPGKIRKNYSKLKAKKKKIVIYNVLYYYKEKGKFNNFSVMRKIVVYKCSFFKFNDKK